MNSTSVEPVEFEQGLRVNHPDLEVFTRNFIKMGLGNEEICKRVGVPGSYVDKVRGSMRKDVPKR
jgi:hypothetical protein